MDDKNLSTRVDEVWSSRSKQKEARRHWWNIKRIIKHVNNKVCGRPLDTFSAGIVKKAKELIAERALKDKHLLDLVLIIDDLASDLGENHYAAALALKDK